MADRSILHCIPSMGGGGAERQLTYLCQGLTKRGWSVHVALLEGGPNLPALVASQAHIHFLQAKNNYDPLILRKLCRLIGALRPDVVQTWLPMMSVAGGLASWFMGTPWIFSERSSPNAHPRSFRGILRMMIGRWATAIIANSMLGFTYWQSKRHSDDRIYFIPNAIPVNRIASMPALSSLESRVPEGTKIILYAGRLEQEGKNILSLIQALSLVFEKVDGVALLCGEGPLRPAITKLASDLRISDRVILPGYAKNIWSWMKTADVFVSVSHFEGCSNSVMEAMAAGCPMVLSDIDSQREIVDEKSAFLAKPDRPDEIASAIIDAISDRESALQKARTARKLAERWSTHELAVRHDEAYSEILVRMNGRSGRI